MVSIFACWPQGYSLESWEVQPGNQLSIRQGRESNSERRPRRAVLGTGRPRGPEAGLPEERQKQEAGMEQPSQHQDLSSGESN